MKIAQIISILAVALISMQSQAQSLYSKEFAQAVKNGTRSVDGVPGPNYKNNYSEYRIDAAFSPDSAMLSGEEIVTYHFNTPDSRTRNIVFNLYRNIYKKGVARHRDCNPADITDEGVVLESVEQKLEGGFSPLDFTETDTKATVKLPSTLNSGDAVTLKVKWHVKIATETHHRGGKYGNGSWFVPYWYPQVAVYDDLYGWDLIEHSANEEFLQEFADYDVTIDLGSNMLCWATGTLQNPAEIYSAQVIASLNKAKQSSTLVPIVSAQGISKALKRSSNKWHYKASGVNDFVFGCSNEMKWSAMSLALQPGKPRVLAGAVFKTDGFASVAGWAKSTIEYLSKQRPAYIYPYPHMTIFEGSGGMEFPMMVNEDFDGSYDSDFFTTSHEVTHSYFPFITGMYQNRYGFMDEGLTQYVPQYFQNSQFRSRNIIKSASLNTMYMAGSDINVPIMTPSYSMTDRWVFTINSYWKPQIAYTTLEDIVGSEAMDKILHDFTQAWAGKHPHPFDFFNMCQKVSGLDLQEFFHSWFFIKGIPDLGLRRGQDGGIVVYMEGDMMLPIRLVVNYEDGTSEAISRNALAWAGGKREISIPIQKPWASAKLFSEDWTIDINSSNDEIYQQ